MLTRIVDRIADRVRWGYLLAFIILLCSYILTFYSTQQVLNQQNWVMHTTAVGNTLDNLFSKITESESSCRGYLISGDERFLEDYNKQFAVIDSTFHHLRVLTKDNDLQQRRLDTLQVNIKNKLDFLSSKVLEFKKNNNALTDSTKKSVYSGKELMDRIRNLVYRMQEEENSKLHNRISSVNTFSNFIKIINICSLILAILLAFYSIIAFNKENLAKQASDTNAQKFREQLEQRVKELDKLNTELLELRSIEKFAATGRITRTIAHEVRNPLTNINLAIEHLKTEIPHSPDTEMLFDMITRNSNRINLLISDLLNSTKATQLNFQKVSVNKLLDTSLGFAQDRIDLKKIKVIKKYAADLKPIMADAEKLNIAFLNIIVNAIEAMKPETGVLEIKTEDKNDRCVVTITDNGVGMNKESLTKLFEPYFTTKEKGTGLGLTNTQNIILGHKASILAESEEGKGTWFIVSFNYA